MITVIGRKLVIPKKESQIGTTYDNDSEVRYIRINRITTGGVDLSNLRFRLDLEYEDAILDTCLLDIEVQEAYILLTWNIPATCVSHKGTVWIAVRAYDESGTIKWATNRGAVYVEHTIFDGDAYKGHLTEFEQLEERITLKAESLDANESERQEAEKQRKANEERRVNNEAEWQRQAETAITEANTTLEKATEKADTAKREADTATAKAKEASDSAEAAGLSKDKAEMAANTAVTKAQEVQTNVDAAVELKELSLQAAITATDKAAESNASAERAESSTTLILQAEATVTKTAAQVKADAKTAADSKDIAVSEATKATEKASQADASAKEVQRIVEGLGGFDGTAEHVLAIDTQGIAGDAGGTSNVQALLNVLAQKVALELVSNSALATMLSGYIAKSCIKNTGLVTEEGFVADARQLNPEIADTLAARVKKNAEDIVTANSNLASIGTGTQLAVLSMDNKTMTGISFKNYKTIEIMVIIQQTSNGNMFFNFTLVPLVSHILNETRYIAIPGKSYGYCANVLLSINYSAGTVTLIEVDVNTEFTLNAIYILGLK